MGWFSSSPSTDTKSTAQPALQPTSQPPQQPTIQPTMQQPVAETTPTSPPAQIQPEPQPQLSPPPPSQPIDPDAEFHAAFPHLAPSSSSSTPSNPSQSTAHATLNPHQTASTSDASVYPTTMSCRAAFDSAFYCSSLGGHFNDIYRYGQLRSCSEHWADWRFCMGLKSKGREEKAAAVQDRYRDKEEKVRGRANSEDIWRRRTEAERVENPFGKAGEE